MRKSRVAVAVLLPGPLATLRADAAERYFLIETPVVMKRAFVQRHFGARPACPCATPLLVDVYAATTRPEGRRFYGLPPVLHASGHCILS